MTSIAKPFDITQLGTSSQEVDMTRVASIILGGGQGTRLYPLTENRCKPAICFGGRYRLIDVPISNALNSGLKNIFVITQFLANSLHRHIQHTYSNNLFSHGCVDILSVEQKPGKAAWFQGTAMPLGKISSIF